MLRRDPDVSVASAALSTLCVFDAFTTPRAPPIMIPTRVGYVGETANNDWGMTASALMHGMSKSKMEIAASKEAQDKRRAEKSDTKSSKKAKKEAIDAETHTSPDPKRIVSCNSHIPEETKVANEVIAVADERSESEINSKPSKDSGKSDVRDEHASVAQSLPKTSINIEEKNEPQTTSSDLLRDGVDASMVDGVHAEQHEEENEDEEDSDGSMDDFPDIVDEDPDEEDRVLH